MTTLAVFGLGYVGTVSAACFAHRGCSVIGVDVSAEKVDLVNNGRSPVYEQQIGEMVRDAVDDGRLRATSDAVEAVANSDVGIICVGTPSDRAGGLGLDSVRRVISDIGEALVPRVPRYEIIVRSTMLPGTTEDVIVPLLESTSGLRAGESFGIAVNPEFLREGTSVADFFSPPKTVIGAIDEVSARRVAELYEGLPGPVHVVNPAVAEMTKYADNSFHALKVAFANELGSICKTMGIDSHELMDIFVSDTKLNVSAAYLKPGFAFGGSCLPKDVRAISYLSRHMDLDTPVLGSILPSNDSHINRTFDTIESFGPRRIGLYGLAFKSGTDDLRESPTVALAERLLGRGYDLRIFDPQVKMSQIVGANRAYVESRIPHLSRLIADDAVGIANWADVNVVVDAGDDVVSALRSLPADRPLLALTRAGSLKDLEMREGYHGVAW